MKSVHLPEDSASPLEQEESEKPASNIVPLAPFLSSLTPDMVADVAPPKRYFWSGFAVAASVAFAIVVGGNLLLNPAPTNAPALAVQNTENTLTVPVTSLAELKKQPMDIDNLRLQNYLRQHAEQATMTVGRGMIPMARIASYPIKE